MHRYCVDVNGACAIIVLDALVRSRKRFVAIFVIGER